MATYNASFASHSGFQTEYRLRRADGEYRWVLDIGVPQFALDAGFTGYIGSCSDITEVKHTREQALASQKLESLGILASGIAHDFNNLLGTILADAELALTEVAPGSACGEEIQRIRTVAIRASEIVRELMNYAGQGDTALEPVDLSLLLQEMLQLLRISIPKCTELKTDFARHLPPVLANAPQLRQVAMNLIINAAEAIGPEGGVIHLVTSRWNSRNGSSGKRRPNASRGRLRVSGGIRYRSRDERGNAGPHLRSVLYDEGNRQGSGTGRRQSDRGHVRRQCQSDEHPGAGDSLRDSVSQCSRSGAAEPHRPGAGGDRSSHDGKVLLVEDEEGLRVATAKMLRKHGLSIIEASDGWAAIELIRKREQEIDLILLDMTIPGASSTEVFAEAQRIRPETKIVLTTAYSREAAAPSFDAPQLKGFIRKPYQFAELMQLLREALSR